MTSIIRSLSLRQIGAILVFPLILAGAGLGCSKANEEAAEAAQASNVLSITTQPADIEVDAPAPVTLSVEASGSNLSFQWMKDGEEIDSEAAKAATFTIESSTVEDSGTYKVIVTDENEQTVESNEVQVNVTASSGGSDDTDDSDNSEADPEDETANPLISSFSPSSSSISYDGSVTLSWVVSNATSLSLDNGIGSVTGDSITVNPVATTTYTLTATNAKGSITATARVNVGSTELPVIDSFVAKSSNLLAGKSIMLTWKVSNATSLVIDNGVGTVTGTDSVMVNPVASTTYTLTATNAFGSVQAKVEVSMDESSVKKYNKFSVLHSLASQACKKLYTKPYLPYVKTYSSCPKPGVSIQINCIRRR